MRKFEYFGGYLGPTLAHLVKVFLGFIFKEIDIISCSFIKYNKFNKSKGNKQYLESHLNGNKSYESIPSIEFLYYFLFKPLIV